MIYGWKALDVYFQMQLRVHHLKVYNSRYTPWKRARSSCQGCCVVDEHSFFSARWQRASPCPLAPCLLPGVTTTHANEPSSWQRACGCLLAPSFACYVAIAHVFRIQRWQRASLLPWTKPCLLALSLNTLMHPNVGNVLEWESHHPSYLELLPNTPMHSKLATCSWLFPSFKFAVHIGVGNAFLELATPLVTSFLL